MKKYPLKLIFGPCAYESVEQMEQVINAVRNAEKVINDNAYPMMISGIRCSLFKPRTCPGTFEGYGLEGGKELMIADKFMQWPKANYAHPLFATEIPDGEMLKKCFALGYRHFWIGARTTTNPFSVQDIANAIQEICQTTQSNRPLTIGIKNPMNDDVSLWRGAFKRVLAAGIQPYLIFRGTSNRYEKTFRNSPSWDVAFMMKQIVGDNVSILLDPSHMAGQWNYIKNLSIAGLSSGLFDGLMVEFHPNPAKALSDAGQQLSLDKMEDFVKTIGKFWFNFLKPNNEDLVAANDKIKEQRDAIIHLDKEFFNTIEDYIRKRRTHTDYIGSVKREVGLPVFDAERYTELVKELANTIDPEVYDLAGQFFKLIHDDSANRQIIL